MAEDENGINGKRIDDDAQRKNVDRMEDVEEEKIQDGENPVVPPVGLEHEFGKENGLTDIAPGPAEVHLIHLAKFRGDFGVDDRVRLIAGEIPFSQNHRGQSPIFPVRADGI